MERECSTFKGVGVLQAYVACPLLLALTQGEAKLQLLRCRCWLTSTVLDDDEEQRKDFGECALGRSASVVLSEELPKSAINTAIYTTLSQDTVTTLKRGIILFAFDLRQE